MKTTKTILVASSSVLAAGMAQGAIVYHSLDTAVTSKDVPINFDLNADGNNDFKVFFDSNTTKPCVQGLSNSTGPTAWVFNQMVMGNNNNGMPVIPYGTPITSQFTVGDYTVSPSLDSENNRRGYLYQSETKVGEWPTATGSDTYGYAALALVDTTVTPATTNYGWVQIELQYTTDVSRLRVIDYAYETTPGASINAGDNGLTSPRITQSPTNQTVVAGSIVTMKVFAGGKPTPGYQWKAGAVGSGVYTNVPNAGNFSGSDTPTLTISDVTPANQLDYIVVAFNTIGSDTSSPPATLTVLPVGVTGPVPSQQVIYAGYPAKFTVTDLGGGFTNQWKKDGTVLSNGGFYSGVTSSNLLISSVTSANLGNYQAIVTTAYGSTNSSIASLGIAYPDGSLYESAVRAYGAVSYYRLNETSGTNAWDFIGGKTGIYNSPNASFGNAGPTATDFPGFVSMNYSAAFQADFNVDTNAYISLPPWNLNTNTVTLTAWIYPLVTEGAPGLNSGILFSAGTGNVFCGIRYDGTYANTNGINDANIGYSWNNDYGAGTWNSQITAPHNEWSLVALTVSPTDATLYIINNSHGVQSAVNTQNHTPALFNGTEYIGTYPSEGPLGVNNFCGYIDEVAIFNSTLSSNQVSALYQSALGQNVVQPVLTITPAGANTQVRWTGGVLLQANNLSGPWITNSTATSPYTISPTSSQQFFRAKQ